MGQILFMTKVGIFVTLLALIYMNDPNDASVLLSERVFTIYALMMAMHRPLSIDFTYGCLFLFEHMVNCRRIKVSAINSL